MSSVTSCLLVAVVTCSCLCATASAAPIRPLAQDYVVVGESPDPANVPLYNPSLVRIDSGPQAGRLLGCYTVSGRRTETASVVNIVASDDHGATWQILATVRLGQPRLFTVAPVAHGAGKTGKPVASAPVVYLIGSGSPLRIMRSDDAGATWSAPVKIADGNWHQSATNFITTNGYVYLALEKRATRVMNAWPVGELAPVLMRARIDADLTRPESWTFAGELAFQDVIPGYRENDPQIDGFGVPFFRQQYPDRAPVAGGRGLLPGLSGGPVRTFSPMGWLETNVAQITDPAHIWHDPAGKTFHLLMRAHTGGTGYAALLKVVEQPDGSMKTMPETVPSGKRILFLPVPGGQMRFHLLRDEQTKLWWLLGSQATDSMTRADLLPRDRYDLPNNERHRLVLHFSKNLVDWCFAGLVATGDSPKEARHYASMVIDGDDLAILSRSGDARARSAHDGNLITFHRVKDFRTLVY
ncbi:hypothetical protein OPIT5_15830 [Opitutaceae bacterium TAV5]|nr:hypothetical protein OPIT5_15830 [Opitutaceae bacterium TAV5]